VKKDQEALSVIAHAPIIRLSIAENRRPVERRDRQRCTAPYRHNRINQHMEKAAQNGGQRKRVAQSSKFVTKG
jgi:hypothetical protein